MKISISASVQLGVMAFAFTLLGTGVQSHAQDAAPAKDAAPAQTAPIVHGIPFQSGIQSTSARSGPHLIYYGGPVMSNVQVRLVYWGPNTNPILAANLPGFYTGVTNSSFFDMFSEYATNITPAGGGNGTNQSIGRGSYVGATVITPSITSSTVDDTQIQAELVRQLNAGHIPAPQYDQNGNVNTEYFIYFPHGMTITQGGSASCVAGGFCAYHGTLLYNGKFVAYAVIPDFGPGSGCDLGCGTGSQIQNVESASSHELIETVTDTAVGLASVVGPPLAWYDTNNGEIGDICNGQQSVISTPAGTYTVQNEYINSLASCVAVGPHPKFSLTSAASSVGTPFSLTVTAQNPTTGTHISFAGTAHFTSTDPNAVLPADYTFVPSDRGVHVFNVTLNKVGASVTATETVNSSITGAVTPATAPGFKLAAPASLTVGQGDYATYVVNETPSGGFSSPITLSVTGAPAGTYSNTTVNPFTGYTATTILTVPTTPLGTYPITITGTSGTLSHSIYSTLVVTPHGAADFSLAITPTVQTVTRGNSVVYNITDTPVGGFSGSLTPVSVNVPTGATATFGATPFTGGTTVTIATAPSTPTGTYYITIAAYSGPILHYATITLKVQ